MNRILFLALVACGGAENTETTDDTLDDTGIAEDTGVIEDTDPGEPGICDTLSPYAGCTVEARVITTGALLYVDEHNARGQRIRRTREGESHTIVDEWTYDGFNLTTYTTTFTDTSPSEGAAPEPIVTEITWEYDAEGRLIADPYGTTYTYGEDGRQTGSQIDTTGDGVADFGCTRDWESTEADYVDNCSDGNGGTIRILVNLHETLGLPVLERTEVDFGGGNSSVYETRTNYADDCQILQSRGTSLTGNGNPSATEFFYDEDRRLTESYDAIGQYEYTYLNCD